MKKVAAIIIAILLISSSTAQAEITDVFIFPEEPIEIDPITIITSGVENYGGVRINSSSFLIDGSSLELDIFLDLGRLDVQTPWSYSEDIGALLMGTYDLTVNTIFESEPYRNDSYYTTFEVTPEPATILLFAMGAIAIRMRRRGS
jgi:hypothetical protein